MNPITVNHLTTKFDYADFKVAAAKAAIKKSEKLTLRVIGTLLILAALILRCFFGGTVSQNVIYIVMGVLGVIVGCFYEIIAHYAARKRAFSEFESNKEKFIAQVTVFYENQITFQTDRYTAEIPYELLYNVYEDDRVFIIYTGIGEMRFIPKRAISKSECTQIRNMIQPKLQEKYQQEGVR